jgi:F-box and WD-40 domain protein CDC4
MAHSVVTTTTTTTTYAPITLPPLPRTVVPSNPKDYPLLHAELPDLLRAFPMELPGGTQATYRHDESDLESDPKEEVIGGRGWRMLRRDQDADAPKDHRSRRRGRTLWQKASIRERAFDGRCREHCRLYPHPSPQEVKATPLPPISMPPAAPPSPLPSPGGSPSPQTLNIWPSAPPSGASSPQPQLPIQPDLSLTTLLALPSMLSHFLGSPPSAANARTVDILTELSALGYQDYPFGTHPYHVQGFPDATTRRTHLSYTKFPSFHHSRSGLARLQGLAEYHRF